MLYKYIQIVHRGVEAFNARGIEALIELFDPEAEFHAAFAAATTGTAYRGHDGLQLASRSRGDLGRDLS